MIDPTALRWCYHVEWLVGPPKRRAIADLIEENRLLRGQLDGRRLRYTDGNRRC
jgi:hypothetical protein